MKNTGGFLILLLLAACSGGNRFPEGGYPYPAPYADNRQDSFLQNWYRPLFYSAWNEPDLTRQPAATVTIRLLYQTVFGHTVLITLTADSLVVKKSTESNGVPNPDMNQLTRKEQYHYRVLRYLPPDDGTSSGGAGKRQMDSLIKIYPQLADTGYFKYLLRKSLKTGMPPFRYNKQTRLLPSGVFSTLLRLINRSGFWALPRHIACDKDYVDGWGVLLEINTPKKYKSVSLAVCTEKAPEFIEACKAIINTAGLGGEIKLGVDE